MKIRAIQTAIAATGLCFMVAVATNGARADELVHVSTQVSVAGLDLATPEGARMASYRIQRAAQSLCETPGADSLVAHRAFRQCKAGAIKDAMAQLNVLVASARGIGKLALK